MVVEGTRCNYPTARAVAEGVIRGYIAERYPDDAERLTDFVSTVMAGLSAKARSGHDLDRLLATARLSGLALARAIPA